VEIDMQSIFNLEAGFILETFSSSYLGAARCAALDFFAKPLAYKKAFTVGKQLESGYQYLSPTKEMFMLRNTDCPEDLVFCRQLARELHQFSLQYLVNIFHRLQLDPNTISEFIAGDEFHNNEKSNSILRILKYEAGDPTAYASDMHQDLGLLTLVTHTGVPAIEVYDFEDDHWIEPESIQSPDELFIMAGESLSLISNGLYIPANHRVKTPDTTRLAINYQLRFKPDAQLTSSFFTTDVTQHFSQAFNMTGAEFLHFETSRRTSVNGSY
jgi:isopenicillin N synthase-like dioxygenase